MTTALAGVTFLDATVNLAFIDGRPFVPVAPICTALGIDVGPQLRRIARHVERSDIPAKLVETAGWSIALEDLSWFLRTLRPAQRNAERLSTYRKQLPWFLICAVVQFQGRYLASDADKALRGQLPNTAPKRSAQGSRYTTRDGQRMVAMHSQGHSYREIAKEFRCSDATAHLIVNGKYPVALRADPLEAALTPQKTPIKASDGFALALSAAADSDAPQAPGCGHAIAAG